MSKLKIILEKIDILKTFRKQRKLIKSDDDSMIIESLPLDEDNSALDIKKIVSSMESEKEMAKVVANNISELIAQDNVKDTMKYLRDEDKSTIVKRFKDELKDEDKLINAIESIQDSNKKLELTYQNLTYLTDFELAKILNGIKKQEAEKIDIKMQARITKIISKKVICNMIKYGSAWHLSELTESLDDEHKKSIFECCIKGINEYEQSENKKFSGKNALVGYFYSSRIIDLDECKEKEILTKSEINEIKEQEVIEIEKKKAKDSLNRRQRMR